jgi:hypothetical protein
MHGRGKNTVPTKIWYENFNKTDFLKNMGIDTRIILKRILNKQECGMWTGFIWLRIGISDRQL